MVTKAKKQVYNKDYYEKHKDKILNDAHKIIHCDLCNCDIRKNGLWRHKQTKKHKQNATKPIQSPTMDDIDKINENINTIMLQLQQAKILNEVHNRKKRIQKLMDHLSELNTEAE